MNAISDLICLCLFVVWAWTGYHQVNAYNCGQVILTRPLIVNGTKTLRGEWPFLVALYNAENLEIFCGGTLISQRHVLTAAHCVQNKYSFNVISPSILIVHLGAYDLSSKNEEGAVTRSVSKIDVHPDWNVYKKKFDADIAILTLSENVTFSDFIQPVCIPANDTAIDDAPINVKGFIIGWALEGNQTHAEIPRHAHTKVLNASYCLTTDPHLAQFASQRTFCGENDNISPNLGDSGGGFLVLSGWAWVQFGIISASRTNQTGHIRSNSFSIYTNAKHFRSWIVEKTDGEASEANGMNIFLNCEYIDYDEYYICRLSNLDIENENLVVVGVVGSHLPNKTDQNVNTILFHEGSMLYLPNGIGNLFKDLKRLQASSDEYDLEFVKRSNFQHMDNLIDLRLSDNKIKVLDEYTLWDLKNLQIFEIKDNSIEKLHEKTFERNPKLREVNFHNNNIRHLPEDVFKMNLLLEIVNFGFNFLIRIDTKFFGLANIIEIDFNSNVCIDDARFERGGKVDLIEFDRLVSVNCTTATIF